MPRLAIIGSGIAGLASAYFLRHRFNVTVFEQDARFGGHINTILVPGVAQNVAFDTGFMVFNKVTYPNLLTLFNCLGVDYKPTDMSFSVHDDQSGIEWNGAGLNKIFGQRQNLLRPKFWRMLIEMNRFCREATAVIDDPEFEEMTVKQFTQSKSYSSDFQNLFLIPMSGAIWSTSPDMMLDFPIRTLLKFFENHGFLGLDKHHQWYTVVGGASSYARKLVSVTRSQMRLCTPVSAVRRNSSGVTLDLPTGPEDFDYAILASHADQSLRILADPSSDERQLLGAFSYQTNDVLVHTDIDVMPRTKRCWAAWNYRIDNIKRAVSPAGTLKDRLIKKIPSTHYWMNRLQGIPTQEQYFVSLNADHLVDESKVLGKLTYEHPVFSISASRAQKKLESLNRRKDNKVFFCGSYFRYGFHEDALLSAVNLCRELLAEDVWQVLNTPVSIAAR